jgi:hypothetical protein
MVGALPPIYAQRAASGVSPASDLRKLNAEAAVSSQFRSDPDPTLDWRPPYLRAAEDFSDFAVSI